jgi:hypothetical protein
MARTISRFTKQSFARYTDATVSIRTKGATALDQTTSKGLGAVITRTGTGEYLMTTTTPAKDFIAGTAMLQMATPDGSYAVTGPVTHNSDGTYGMVIQTWGPAAGNIKIDVADAANNVLNGFMTLKVVGP